MQRVQERHLQHIQEQEENQREVGAFEALRILQETHKAYGNERQIIFLTFKHKRLSMSRFCLFVAIRHSERSEESRYYARYYGILRRSSG